MHEETSENAVTLPPVTLPWQCAWCVSERGELPLAGHTHGICRRHLKEWRRKAHDYREWQEKRHLAIVR